MGTGVTGWAGFPPQVLVIERMYLSQLPEEDKEPFMAAFGDRVDRTRAGEPVFPKTWYKKWKSQ